MIGKTGNFCFFFFKIGVRSTSLASKNVIGGGAVCDNVCEIESLMQNKGLLHAESWWF